MRSHLSKCIIDVTSKAHSFRAQTGGQGRTGSRASIKGAGSSFKRHLANCRRYQGSQICSNSNRSSETVKTMEVEVKIRLPDRVAYDKVALKLAAGLRVTHEQENYFFDGPGNELNSKRTVLRLRFYDTDKKAVVTIKGEQVLKDGIGTAPEVEESVDPVLARGYLSNPLDMLVGSPLVKTLAEKSALPGLVCIGGFRNRRQEYEWEGVVLELDETYFEHGTVYEIECETDQPEMLRDKLETLLKSAGIEYGYSGVSKFANFIKKTLL
ncbi:hypothetical protein CEUSTIGMA_g6117.t1 [Chlamydomonas eustigma]|uniref:CYTH domain-containing protein n=1 Tax=Chlamydomonas eustigma TaxID=1157962 RepID=A0A250X6Z0_9CHLO|nr:hypothetical protein CEUSTIGMA_g6117.t1 [Chlamydomonas eustigma]|eukprot:GAX78679.1 hypothetical protein CEUSTIGMA_g6117.t1 [Chlamydomonas eustigma]